MYCKEKEICSLQKTYFLETSSLTPNTKGGEVVLWLAARGPVTWRNTLHDGRTRDTTKPKGPSA